MYRRINENTGQEKAPDVPVYGAAGGGEKTENLRKNYLVLPKVMRQRTMMTKVMTSMMKSIQLSKLVTEITSQHQILGGVQHL